MRDDPTGRSYGTRITQPPPGLIHDVEAVLVSRHTSCPEPEWMSTEPEAEALGTTSPTGQPQPVTALVPWRSLLAAVGAIVFVAFAARTAGTPGSVAVGAVLAMAVAGVVLVLAEAIHLARRSDC